MLSPVYSTAVCRGLFSVSSSSGPYVSDSHVFIDRELCKGLQLMVPWFSEDGVMASPSYFIVLL